MTDEFKPILLCADGSLPNQLTAEDLERLGLTPVMPTSRPDPQEGMAVEEGPAECVEGVWHQTWLQVPAQVPELPALPALKQEATRAIDAQHEAVLLQLTGNPTQAEQTTWAGKVALAEAIQQGLPLSAAQSGFLAAMGVPAAGRAQYAQTVLAKSAAYWLLVGVADKVRSDCKDRIASATTHDALAQAGVQNRAQLERALAAVSTPTPPTGARP